MKIYEKIKTVLCLTCFLKANDTCIQNIFDQYKITEGGFVFYQDKQYQTNNLKWVTQRYIPASTFKVFHALIGLELKKINTKDIFFFYSGEKLEMEQWQKTMMLKEAIKTSNVPAFKVLAKNIGFQNMLKNIKKLHYGNQNIGSAEDLQTFWLKGPLKISPIEQVDLLFALAQKKLSFSKKAQEEIIKILKQDKKRYSMYSKTGLSITNNEKYSWLVGWVSQNETSLVIPFALHFKMEKNMLDNPRFHIVEEIIQHCIFKKP